MKIDIIRNNVRGILIIGIGVLVVVHSIGVYWLLFDSTLLRKSPFQTFIILLFYAATLGVSLYFVSKAVQYLPIDANSPNTSLYAFLVGDLEKEKTFSYTVGNKRKNQLFGVVGLSSSFLGFFVLHLLNTLSTKRYVYTDVFMFAIFISATMFVAALIGGYKATMRMIQLFLGLTFVVFNFLGLTLFNILVIDHNKGVLVPLPPWWVDFVSLYLYLLFFSSLIAMPAGGLCAYALIKFLTSRNSHKREHDS